jgi:mannose-1-phosphate guanylyltransferase
MLDWWLERCFASGVSEVLINIHAHGAQVQQHVQETAFSRQVKVSEEPVLLGSAGTIGANRDWVGNDDAFWVLYADVLTNVDLREFAAFHRRFQPPVTLGITKMLEPSRCGIVTVDADGVVTHFEEKPQRPTSDLGFSGIMIGTQDFLQAIPRKRPADIGYDVLPFMRQMRVYHIQDYLLDIGTLENYARAQETWPGWTPTLKG